MSEEITPVAKKPARRKGPARVTKSELKVVSGPEEAPVEDTKPDPKADLTPEQAEKVKAIAEELANAPQKAPVSPEGTQFVMDRIYFHNSIQVVIDGKRRKLSMVIVTPNMQVQMQDGWITIISRGVCRIHESSVASIVYKKG